MNFIKLNRDVVDKLHAFEDSLRLGLYDESMTLDDFKKLKMKDELAGSNECYRLARCNEYSNPSLLDCELEDDKYIIVKLIINNNDLLRRVAVLEDRMQRAADIINDMVNAQKTYVYKPMV